MKDDPMNRRRPRRLLVALPAVALIASACLTTRQEADLGAEEAKKVEQTMGLVRDAKVDAYVRAIGEKIAAVSNRPEGPWSFLVVDRPEPNAFALPGGYVYVTRGLLTLVNSEDELAGVVGHEIAHVTARHSSKRIGAAVVTAPIAIAAGIAGFAVSIVSPFLGNIVAGTGQVLTTGLVLAPFSREQEHEADKIGQGLAARAGYDPAGISTFLHTLGREVELESGKQQSFHFFASHPQTPDRVGRTAQRAAQLTPAPARPVARGHSDFLARIEGIVVGEDPAQGIFEESLFLHPEFDLAISFPEGWKTQNAAMAVGAISPGKDALVALRLAEQDASLDDTVKKIEAEEKGVSFDRFEIRGLPAARTRLSGRGQIADVTLIGYRGNVFAVVGECADKSAEGYGKVFDSTARSFRALRSSERDSIRESRLRVRKALLGEAPPAIVDRTRSSWDSQRLAIANGVKVDERFRSGQEVKVALPQPYTPRGE
jgi:predicted Zn-dependent protease